MNGQELNFTIERLGECRLPSPMQGVRFTADSERILYHARFDEIRECLGAGTEPPTLELAGPRQRIFFDPAVINCGSSSIKYEVFDRKERIKLATGLVERIGSAQGRMRQSRRQADGSFVEQVYEKPLADHDEAFRFMAEMNRNIDFLHTFLKRKKEVDQEQDPRLVEWLEKLDRDRVEAAREFWYETLKGIDESLREFF